MASGFTLADIPHRVSWADLAAMVAWSRPGTALYSQTNGKDAMWTPDAQLLAAIVDGINTLIWLYSRMHGGKGQAPDQIPRPGVKQRNSSKEQIGSDPIPIADFDEWWTKGYRNG